MTETEKILWLSLYEVAENLKMIQPWNCIYADDSVLIRSQKTGETALCSVMGSVGLCCGVSVYIGIEGIASYARLSQPGEYAVPMMYDHTCLTLFYGDRNEVPKEQKAIIKELGLKFRGNGNWPYVLSFKRRYIPCTPNQEELTALIEYLQNLFMVAAGFTDGRLDPDGWDGKSAMIRFYNEEQDMWNMGWMEWKLPKPDYPKFQITDELRMTRLKKLPGNGRELLADLIYLDDYIVAEDNGRCVAALIFVMADLESQMVVCADMVPPQIDEQVAAITGFVNYLEANGKVRRVKVRNPYVFSGLKDTCKKCKIQLVLSALPEMDEIAQELTALME